MCRVLLIALLCSAATSLWAEEESAPNDGQPASAQQVQQWLRQLDDDRFDTRQQAQRKLEQANPAPLKEVAVAARQGSLESTTRALNILLAWSDSDDLDLQMRTLEQLANMSHRPREAAMATRVLAEHRERIAIEQLIELGAQINDTQLGIVGIGNRQVLLDKRWKGGNEGLKLLLEVQRVTYLKIHGTAIDNRGIVYLKQLPEVLRIELFGAAISDAGEKELQSHFPPGTVDRRNDAMLGIRGAIGGRCLVTEVGAESAAAKAGIQPNDKIVAFNGEPIVDFQDLTEKIGEKKAGESAMLTIERGVEKLELQVTFDAWGAKEHPLEEKQAERNLQLRGLVPPPDQALPNIPMPR